MSERFVRAASLVAIAAGHGMLTLPASRNGGILDKAGVTNFNDDVWRTASWFTQGTDVPHETNCDEKYATVITCKDCSAEAAQPAYEKLCRKTPWRAPGVAEVVDPCGCSQNSPADVSGCAPGHTPYLHKGTDLPKTQQLTQWTARGTAKVAFSSSANHGGGYAYRLCPAGAEQTEECFQNNHLDFVGGNSTVRWTTGKELEIAALTLSSGTHPPSSQWRAIRIPGCAGWRPSYSRDLCNPPLLPRQGITFPGGELNHASNWDFSVEDTVAVPSLPAGEYTLSWRWDTEINRQVWQNCADIEIVYGGPALAPITV